MIFSEDSHPDKLLSVSDIKSFISFPSEESLYTIISQLFIGISSVINHLFVNSQS